MGTALITGASSGIGKTFAKKLAQQGYDLIIVARREERLQALAQELREQYSGNITIITADLSEKAGVQKILEAIQSCEDLDLLVNNAGFSVYANFMDVPLEKHLEMIHLHIDATVRFCYAALPKMKERRKGAIINVSSFGGFIPMPKNATYNATKAYLISFSDSLSYEVAQFGITIQVLCPSFTRTEIFDIAGLPPENVPIPYFAWMSTDEVVTASLNGLKTKRRIVTPRLMYQLGRRFLNLPIINHLFKWYMNSL
jgi:short-subunit dehydrogenase